MGSDERDDEREEKEPTRPRVVDKRVSTRTSRPEAASSESAPQPSEQDSSRDPTPTRPQEPPPSSEPPPAAAAPTSPPKSDRPAEAGPGATPPPGGGKVWTPEEEAEARRAAQEMAAVPARDWVLNVAVTLANVAGIKIQDGQLEDAQLTIDAFSGMVEKIESQMGDAGPVLRQTLAQLQMAYAQAVSPPSQPQQ
jgi:hypothetical protein